ncbi:MAG: hypothetical protein ACMUIE_06895 [Thermoplasmatota archaeon]
MMIETPEGGEWVDGFPDEDWVERTSGVEFLSGEYKNKYQEEIVLFEEDFESYRSGQNLFGVNGWIEDTNRAISSDTHQFTATTSGPGTSPSTTVGKIYNPSSSYSYILSKEINITNGILTCWFSTDHVWSDAASGMISLMKSGSATPQQEDRVVGLLIRNGGIYYRTTPTASSTVIIDSGISADKWYMFEIRFDCILDKASIYIFNDLGDLMGAAENTDFISDASWIGRVELFTARDYFSTYVTTYWDEIKITPPLGQEFEPGANFREDFETYSSGQNLFGVNGWIEDTNRAISSDNHQFTATTIAPPNKPSIKVGKIYNPDDAYSYVLSQPMDVTSGVLTCWFSADHIFPNAESAMISLMKSQSATPSHDDRVVGLLIRDEGIKYRTTPTGSSEIIIDSGIKADTWYRFEIRFNCTIDKVSFYIYDLNGDLLGAAAEKDFISKAASIGRIELFTTRDQPGPTYTTTYWDDIEIYGLTSERSVVSDKIKVPDSMSWSTLMIEKEEGFGGTIDLEILDEFDMPITGFSYDPSASQLDISPLSSLGYDTIKLKADFDGMIWNSPTLKGWGVDWNGSRSWRESFLTTINRESSSGVDVAGGMIQLASGQTDGSLTTEPISLPAGFYWSEIEAHLTAGSSADIYVDVLDAATGTIIPDMEGFTGDGEVSWDVTGIDPLAYKSVKLKIRLVASGGGNPTMDSISISWRQNHYPMVGSLMIQSGILRTDEALIQITVSDPEQDRSTLDVMVEYRLEPGMVWEEGMLSAPIFNATEDLWECRFITWSDTPVGNYSFKVTVTDRVAFSAVKLFLDATVVFNNIPRSPRISMEPENATTENTISAVLIDNGTDVETEDLLYDYFWYVNDEQITELTRLNQTVDFIAEMSPSYTNKHDTVKCMVRTYDGMDHSGSFEAEVVIGNSKPVLSSDFPSEIIMDEDTEYSNLNISMYISDPDMDGLEFDFTGGDEIGVYLSMNGSVLILPPVNWSGTENITFTASDGESILEFNLSIVVLPVNDAPEFSSLTCDRGEGFTGETFLFTAEASDIDNEELTYTWMVNGETIEMQDKTISLNWTKEYWTETEWMAKMNEKNATVSVLIDDGEFEIGPFEKTVKVNLRDLETYNAAPVINEIKSSSSEIREDGFVILEVDVDDADGDELTIYWSHDRDLQFNRTGAIINVSGLLPGEYIFTVHILDGRNSVTDTIKVTVTEKPEDKGEEGGGALMMIIIIIVVLLVVAGLCAVLFFALRKKKKEEEAPVEPMEPLSEISEGIPGPVREGAIGGASPTLSGSPTAQQPRIPPAQPLDHPQVSPPQPRAALPPTGAAPVHPAQQQGPVPTTPPQPIHPPIGQQPPPPAPPSVQPPIQPQTLIQPVPQQEPPAPPQMDLQGPFMLPKPAMPAPPLETGAEGAPPAPSPAEVIPGQQEPPEPPESQKNDGDPEEQQN